MLALARAALLASTARAFVTQGSRSVIANARVSAGGRTRRDAATSSGATAAARAASTAASDAGATNPFAAADQRPVVLYDGVCPTLRRNTPPGPEAISERRGHNAGSSVPRLVSTKCPRRSRGVAATRLRLMSTSCRF